MDVFNKFWHIGRNTQWTVKDRNQGWVKGYAIPYSEYRDFNPEEVEEAKDESKLKF